MSIPEQEIVQRIRNLSPEHQQRLLAFLQLLEEERPLTALEIMQLPPDERQRHVRAAIESAAYEDFEIFEAYSEERLDDE